MTKVEFPKGDNTRALLGAAGLGAAFLGVAYLGRSSTLFVLLIGVSIAFIIQARVNWGRVLRSMVSPFLPFIMLVVPIAFLQPKVSETLWLLSIPASYIFARLLRAQFSLNWLAGGAVIVGIVMGGVRLGSTLATGDIGFALSKIAESHHKNLVGWAITMGLISAIFIARQASRPLVMAILFWCCVASLSMLVLSSNSVTSILAAIIGLVVMGIFAPTSTGKARRQEAGRAGKVVTLGIAAGFVALTAFANLYELPPSNLLSKLARESNLTGRTAIWECYYNATSSGVEQVQRFVWDCSRGASSNLHSSFLEAHSFGGWLLLLTVLLGFALAIGLGIRRALKEEDLHSRREGAMEAAIAAAAFVIALVESYLFSRFSYLSIVIFLSSGVTASISAGVLNRTISRITAHLDRLVFWRDR